MKQTFNIPAGCKTVSIEEVGNTIVTSFEPEFKKGDFVAVDETKDLCYTVGIYNNSSEWFFGYNTRIRKKDARVYETHRYATESEKQILLDKMHEAGYDWDAEKCEVVPYRWRPNSGEEYVYPAPITPDLYLTTYWLDLDEEDIHRWKNGLVFKVGEEEKAIEKAKKMLEA